MKRITWSAVLTGVAFAAGYILAVTVPGGGSAKDSDFAKYYDSNGRQALGLIGALLLVAAIPLGLWFLFELRAALGTRASSIGAQLGNSLAAIGLTVVAIGAAITLGPTGVQMNSDADFGGVPLARAISQAGLSTELLVGMGLLAVATILLALAARGTGAMVGWVATAGVVVGVLLFGSYIFVPGLLFPLWLLAIGFTGLRPASSAS